MLPIAQDQSWNIVLNIMTGISMSVKSVEMVQQELQRRDFQAKFYFELVPRRSMNDKFTFKVCKFVDYAPNVFQKIRHLYNIKSEEYLRSIGPETLLQSLMKGN